MFEMLVRFGLVVEVMEVTGLLLILLRLDTALGLVFFLSYKVENWLVFYHTGVQMLSLYAQAPSKVPECNGGTVRRCMSVYLLFA